MDKPDIHWQQRLANYVKALEQLGNAVAISRQRPLSDLEKLGHVHTFAFTHELAWNVMKDYFAYQGNRKSPVHAMRCARLSRKA